MSKALRTNFALLYLLLLGLSIHVQFLASFYGDKQWEMLYAQMWLAGKRLYIDLFTVAPPLITWIYAVPAALAKGAGTSSAFTMLVCLGLVLIAFSIFLCVRLIALHPGFAGVKERQIEFIALLLFVLEIRTSSMFFLDREHLFYVLTLPYALRFLPSLMRAPVPAWLRAATGLFAGVGFCIKPHCLIVWAGIQLLYMIFEKSPRILASTENILIYITGLCYVLLVWRLYPDYFSTVVPMAAVTYSAARDGTPVIDYATNALAVLVLTFLMFRLRDRSPYRRDIFYLAGLCPFFLLYPLINNNWAYTYYPLGSATVLLTGFVLWEFLYLRGQQKSRRFTTGIWLCAIVMALKVVISLNYFYLVLMDDCHGNIRCHDDDALAEEFKGLHAPATFGAITIDFTRWTRLVNYTGAQWVTRFPQLWMLPKFLASDQHFRHEHEWILTYVAEAYAEDMNTNKPDVMFVDDTDAYYSVNVRLDLVKLFGANADFRAAMAHYRFVHNVNYCGPQVPGERLNLLKCSYDIYRRTD